jgi:hypothetical protein
MVRFYWIDFQYIEIIILGKITWFEYYALYIKFHHMNESSLIDFDDVNFIQESYDSNCKFIDFR